MQNLSRRTLAICVLLLGATVSLAAAAQALPCADYVTSGFNDGPAEGFLIGTETVSEELSTGGAILGAKRTVTYEQGIYDFGGGRRLTLDCRDYSIA